MTAEGWRILAVAARTALLVVSLCGLVAIIVVSLMAAWAP